MTDNILLLLQPKSTIVYLEEKMTLRQALEKMRFHGYTAVPVIDEEGKYSGTVSEGDFLWHILDHKENSIYDLEKVSLKEIIRPNFNPCVKVYTPIENLTGQILNQNFVPVVDDTDHFIGIVTRKDILRYLAYGKEQNQPLKKIV